MKQKTQKAGKKKLLLPYYTLNLEQNLFTKKQVLDLSSLLDTILSHILEWIIFFIWKLKIGLIES